MCNGPEQSKPKTYASSSNPKFASNNMNDSTGAVKTEISFSSLLELAADNDVEGFKQSMSCISSAINELGLWYSHQRTSKHMALKHRTPLMVAATYGSIDIVRLILSLSKVDVNRSCGPDKSTALHCAASSGSVNAVEVVKLLLLAGADPESTDAIGHRPIDVIVAPPNTLVLKDALEELLQNKVYPRDMNVSSADVKPESSSFSSSPVSGSLSSPLDVTSLDQPKYNDVHVSSASDKKEYPVDPSLPDIRDSIYSTDEFRMFSFKIRPCSRAYSHDWTECPFAHPGENARRRDPRKFHYSSVPCPDFRKGQCRHDDLCEYAHGVFECWLHPAQYRTRLCKDGTNCARRVCFFAHKLEELRPLYASTGSAVPSPRSVTAAASTMDLASALSFLPCSPSALPAMSPSPFTQSISPSGNAFARPSMVWQQSNTPTLHPPGSNFQTSRLRSSFSARDIQSEELNMLLDYGVPQQQLLRDLSCFSQTNINSSSSTLPARYKTIAPSNLDDMFSAERSSPRFSDPSAVFSPSHKSVVLNQLQPLQNKLSPVNTNLYSPKNVDHPLLQTSFGISSPGRMSPRGMEPQSPFSSRLCTLAQHEKHHRSLGSADLGVNSIGSVSSPVNSMSNWESHNGQVDWSVNGDGLARVRRSFSTRESSPEMKESASIPVSCATSSEGSDLNSQVQSGDHEVLGAWLDQLQLDHIIA
ncbi:hypothetical protein RJ640_027724 [Escallonia rubra]|uniref:C3H1-type domain-containing protein n=1 Tax=Escallonia rubra TaxID=112253 RepID=A0AA88U2E2_9ASTE|nr:hypothetical protein RJ640_027724 [Escallonia rubra]